MLVRCPYTEVPELPPNAVKTMPSRCKDMDMSPIVAVLRTQIWVPGNETDSN